MSDAENTGQIPGKTAVEVARGSSLLQEIKDRREERLADETLVLSIPTWGGELKAKYKVVPRVELDMVLRAQAKKANQKSGSSDADMDFLSRACIAIIASPESDEMEDAEGEVVASGFNEELGTLLGVEGLTSARKVISYMFKGNGIAIATTAMKVAKWMQDTSIPVEDDADPSQ